MLTMEGIMIMNELGNQFTDNGFTITDASKFTKELKAMNMEPYDLLDKLLTLQKQANSKVTIVDFSKIMISKMDELADILESDENYKKSDAKVIQKINDGMKDINTHFEAIKAYLNAEEKVLQLKQDVLDIKRKIYELSKNPNITEQEKTAQTVKLTNEINSLKGPYEEALKHSNEQKTIYNNSVRGINVNDFKNELLTGINSLENDCKNLAISDDTKNKLSEVIQDMRNKTAFFAIDNIKSQNEFEALCSRFGIVYDGGDRSNANIVSNTKEKKEQSKDDSKVADKEEENKEHTESVTPGKETTVQEQQNLDDDAEPIINNDNNNNPEDEVEYLDTSNEPKIKVVARRACKWINKHKKQILIAVGIALLIVATIVALQYLIPAITTMIQSGQIASMTSAMLNNSALWAESIASEQVALHGANTALASAVQTMTGSEAVFNATTGIWTMGGTELGAFAAQMTANATNAVNAVTTISNGVLGLGISGLGLSGLAAVLPKAKSEQYYDLRNEIKTVRKNLKNLNHNSVTANIDEIKRKINNSSLSNDDKQRLINKANKVIDKSLGLVEEEVETLESDERGR